MSSLYFLSKLRLVSCTNRYGENWMPRATNRAYSPAETTVIHIRGSYPSVIHDVMKRPT